jgi:hypothetical protein
MNRKRFLVIVLALLLVAFQSVAQADVINFETFADSEVLTNQVSGLIFTNATVLTAGITLNEFEFPPASWMNVVFDDGGKMTIDFATPQASVGGYFTYLAPLTLTAYDTGGSLLGTDTSEFEANLALSGDPGSLPNEFLGFASAGGITKVTITGDLAGGSFTLDDLTYIPAQPTSVPEPGTLLLLGTGLAGFWFSRRRR